MERGGVPRFLPAAPERHDAGTLAPPNRPEAGSGQHILHRYQLLLMRRRPQVGDHALPEPLRLSPVPLSASMRFRGRGPSRPTTRQRQRPAKATVATKLWRNSDTAAVVLRLIRRALYLKRSRAVKRPRWRLAPIKPYYIRTQPDSEPTPPRFTSPRRARGLTICSWPLL